MSTVIRRAEQSDIGVIRSILESSPEAGAWREIFLAPPRLCLVAEREDRIVAVLLADCPAADEAEILTIAVEAASRRKRIGTSLVQSFLDTRKGRVSLEVRRSNTAAQRLYRALGFAPVGLRRGYYSSPPEDAIIMQVLCN